MKKVFCYLVFAVFFGVNAYSQNLVVDLGMMLIDNEFIQARGFLQRNNFDVTSPRSGAVMGMRGDNPANSLMVIVTVHETSVATREVNFAGIAPRYARFVEGDLIGLGFTAIGEETERRGAHTFTHRTYRRVLGRYTHTVVVTIGQQSGVVGAVFTRTVRR